MTMEKKAMMSARMATLLVSTRAPGMLANWVDQAGAKPSEE